MVACKYEKVAQEASVGFWNRFVDYVRMIIEAAIDNITMENYVMNNIYSEYIFSGSFI